VPGPSSAWAGLFVGLSSSECMAPARTTRGNFANQSVNPVESVMRKKHEGTLARARPESRAPQQNSTALGLTAPLTTSAVHPYPADARLRAVFHHRLSRRGRGHQQHPVDRRLDVLHAGEQGRPITSAAPGLTGTTSYPRRQSSSNNITLKSLGWRDRPTMAIRFWARKSSMISERHSLIPHISPSRKPTPASRRSLSRQVPIGSNV
jgi:hypothetical protein